jgi:hypothetical protein
MGSANEVQITGDDTDLTMLEKYQDAADLATDQNQATFFVNEKGKRLFAVVPVETADNGLHLENPFIVRGEDLFGTKDFR